ncbi:methyl-accepting chemotaxis protein [Sphingomonas changnyeongensis]|uniref:methyl-accepting chemotaxis protein n=1 Tax=Sphingomonas changnyeongensis TaxID=2698679 RepID=UPI00191C67AD|nr:methyl-accepting chemotaxis protein [Sphingomonas changnyeongensis]
MNSLSLQGIRLVGVQVLAALCAGLAVATLGSALFVGGSKLVGALLAVALAVHPVMAALGGKTDDQTRLALGLSVPVYPALLLFVFEGYAWQTDLHMLFFAVLATVTILCDWRAIIGATLVVAVHHLILGMAAPDWVFTGGSNIARVLLHAVILLIETGVLVWTSARLVEMFDKINQENALREQAEKSAAAQREREAETQRTILVELGTSLASLRDGDLTRAIAQAFPEGYAQLRTDFNDALASLHQLVTALSESITAIRGESAEISKASESLARRTEANAASLEETSAAIAQMDQRLKATADAAGRTVERADQTLATVGDGRSVADEAVQAMTRVSDSAKGIDSVIEGLDKIAFQTRVLAMNAAVEAGRAGEAGRGFAVVADLVSALAMRAEEEAKRARDQLSVTQAEIGTAVHAVERVDGALQNISTDVSTVFNLLGEIAADNRSQASAITEINTAILAMDQATQQNAAMVEETSAAARNLTAEVEALAGQAAAFNTGGGRPGTQASAPRPSASMATPAPGRHVRPLRPGRCPPRRCRRCAAPTVAVTTGQASDPAGPPGDRGARRLIPPLARAVSGSPGGSARLENALRAGDAHRPFPPSPGPDRIAVADPRPVGGGLRPGRARRTGGHAVDPHRQLEP